MPDLLGGLTRTHTCGELTAADVGSSVVLLGWVHRVRDLGALIFVDVRDRGGVTQVVAREGGAETAALMAAAKRARSEFVVAVIGRVERRAPETVNARLATGDIEIAAQEIRVLNEAKTPPFPIADDQPAGGATRPGETSEETRLRYRYLDLRRPRLQHNIGLRHRVSLAIRRALDAQGFWEIETPILTKSTPEGARDYLVPSRVHPGEFFALPQSPQIFKQILMVAGMDRYFPIVRCFRDEDLRADRQPEFTQVDLEMSFATPDLVFNVIEPLIQRIFKEIGRDIPTPFQRMPYAEAMARYGSDKPDLRFGLEILDVSSSFATSPFVVFRQAVESGGVVRGLVIPGAATASRRELDELVEQAKRAGAGGLVWVRRAPDGVLQSSALKAAGEAALGEVLGRAGANEQDLLLLAAGPGEATSKTLGALRLSLARQRGLIPEDVYAFAWIVDFPMFEWDAEDKRHVSMHHPFTSPLDEDLPLLASQPGRVRAKAYDLVLNGSEIGGGSIRIHDAALQAQVFRLLAISDEDARLRFGFFLDALEYGTPPHGGIALGLDRIIATLCGESSIREVIAFPKTANAVDLMAGAPSGVDPKQLRELRLKSEA